MKNYFQQWNFMRIIRLATGIYITIQGVMDSQWLFVLLGLIFTMMPIFNIGCCGTSGCSTNMKKDSANNKEIEYEEVS